MHLLETFIYNVISSLGQTFRRGFIILEVKVASGWLPEPRTDQCIYVARRILFHKSRNPGNYRYLQFPVFNVLVTCS
jgi:hypothetical protein